VDNPHTKPYAFWEWVIAEVKRQHPEALFLAEAFTRPHVMHRLAKLGFTQSYTYFTWRSTKAELVEYFTELTTEPARDYFRPNCWPNTPDILPYGLHGAPMSHFAVRLVLAATLAASYGIYGPAYELGENRNRDATSEEYLDSEKYEIKHWDRSRPGNLVPTITKLNHLRRTHPALQANEGLAFHSTSSEALIAYSKRAEDDRVIVVVNLDPHVAQAGWVTIDGAALGLEPGALFEVHDALTGSGYTWRAGANYVILDPAQARRGAERLHQIPNRIILLRARALVGKLPEVVRRRHPSRMERIDCRAHRERNDPVQHPR
jgi:starch synthase (maltosyl-transferring)